ncbi:unnamed protein product [Prorocentrum cordatum]|uniref:RING-type domain-containing protein n=1 Tax=Prorocentrum cordatum TaxID=2364126 RepID=A0ABN9V3E3_9DINO|nr:unnamed protein product [Polarella glacialis]
MMRAAPEVAAPQSDPASMALLNRCPSFLLGAREPEPCVVCREPMLPQERCRRLPCLHLFHEECIDRWVRVKPTCPLDNMRLEDMLAAQTSVTSGGGAPARGHRWAQAGTRPRLGPDCWSQWVGWRSPAWRSAGFAGFPIP